MQTLGSVRWQSTKMITGWENPRLPRLLDHKDIVGRPGASTHVDDRILQSSGDEKPTTRLQQEEKKTKDRCCCCTGSTPMQAGAEELTARLRERR